MTLELALRMAGVGIAAQSVTVQTQYVDRCTERATDHCIYPANHLSFIHFIPNHRQIPQT